MAWQDTPAAISGSNDFGNPGKATGKRMKRKGRKAKKK